MRKNYWIEKAESCFKPGDKVIAIISFSDRHEERLKGEVGDREFSLL